MQNTPAEEISFGRMPTGTAEIVDCPECPVALKDRPDSEFEYLLPMVERGDSCRIICEYCLAKRHFGLAEAAHGIERVNGALMDHMDSVEERNIVRAALLGLIHRIDDLAAGVLRANQQVSLFTSLSGQMSLTVSNRVEFAIPTAAADKRFEDRWERDETDRKQKQRPIRPTTNKTMEC